MLAAAQGDLIADYKLILTDVRVGITVMVTKCHISIAVARNSKLRKKVDRSSRSERRNEGLEAHLLVVEDDVLVGERFISLVKERRAGKLKGFEKTLFSGEFWTAPKAIEFGLADSIGDMRSVLRTRYGEKVRTPLISAERSLFGRRLQGVGLAAALANQPGLADDFVSALESRALWARYGL